MDKRLSLLFTQRGLGWW